MTRSHFKLQGLLMTLILALSSLLFSPAVVLASSSSSVLNASGAGTSPTNKGTNSKVHAITEVDIRITTDKLTGKISSHLTSHAATATPPAYAYLNTSYADWILEPPAHGTDYYGNSYTDWHFANLCGPAAATVSLDYWNNVNTRAIGVHQYSTPSSTTWWGDRNPGGFRDTAYMMYLATQVKPPAYATPGIMSWNPDGATVVDMVTALNWESSNHGVTGTNFYAAQWSPSFSQLRAEVTQDIYNDGVAPIALVNDAYLPDWANSPYKGHGHYVAIIGYNNSASTFTYEETCGPYSCGTSSYGQHTISQQQLLNGINAYSGALIW